MNLSDKSALRLLRERINQALASLEQELGVKLSAANITFDADGKTAAIKLEAVATDQGEVESRYAKDYKQFAAMFKLPADGIGRTFLSRDIPYIIVGLDIKRRKNPVIAEHGITKKQYIFPVSTVKFALERSERKPVVSK